MLNTFYRMGKYKTLDSFGEHIFSRDTTYFLNILPQTIPKDTILASFDMESLYSNILHALGLKAVGYWLTKYPYILNSRFSKDFNLDGIQLLLENYGSMTHISTGQRNGYGY